MLYAHITDFEHKHDNGDLHKADKNYKFKKITYGLKITLDWYFKNYKKT